MTKKQRIKDLERRVAELEQRIQFTHPYVNYTPGNDPRLKFGSLTQLTQTWCDWNAPVSYTRI